MSREVRQGPDGRSPRRTSGGGHGEAVRRVPGYELDSWVATTASGDIWIARNRGSGARVLLKLLQFRTGGPGAGAESRDLARLIGQLREIGHPHLAWVQETIPDGDGAVLVLEYADGGSLDQLMRGRGALDPGEVVTIAGPIAEALAASHGHGLVHGDLTPASIHFTAEGRPLLLDVGLLALAERVTAPSGYADPAETIRPGSAGDVYGLAAVCHATLTGIRRFPASTGGRSQRSRPTCHPAWCVSSRPAWIPLQVADRQPRNSPLRSTPPATRRRFGSRSGWCSLMRPPVPSRRSRHRIRSFTP